MKKYREKLIKRFISHAFLVLTLTFQALIVQSCAGGKGDSKLSAGVNGNLKNIVIPDDPDQVTKFAAAELQHYLGKITGQELPVVELSGINDKVKVIRLVLEKDSMLKWDGYRIEASESGIRLVSGEPRGLLYAVYTLLENSGCLFFYPGEEEEIVPRISRLTIENGTFVYNPILEHRGLTPYGLDSASVDIGRKFIDWMAKNRLNYILVSEDRPSDCDGPAHCSIWKEVTGALLPELQKRGFVIEMSEHCAPVFFPRSLAKDHPDWYAMVNGVRKPGPPPYSGQMCYSNREAVEYYATAIAEYAAKHPEFHVIGTWPLDGGEYCECEPCRDPQTVFNAVKRVAEKVRAVRPDMIVEHLAYKVHTWEPPDKKDIPDNISVLWCADTGETDSIAHKWIERVSPDAGVYQFEYYMGDNYRTRANVWLRPDYSAGVARHAAELGYRGVISLFLPIQNWWRASFNNWFFARACWDPGLDIKANLSRYCHDYYGADAPAVQDIFNLILTRLQPEPYRDQVTSAKDRLHGVQKASEELLSKLDSLTTATQDPAVITRLKRIRTYVEYSFLHTETMASQKPADLRKLADYSREHPEEDMVLMYPGYITWRNE